MENNKEKEYRRAIRVDWMINYLMRSKAVTVPKKCGSNGLIPNSLVGPEYFNNAVAIFGTAGAFDSNVDLYFGDVELSDLPPTWDVTVARFAGQVETKETLFLRVRRLPLKSFRGSAKLEAAFEIAQCAPLDDDPVFAFGSRTYWGLCGGVLRRIESPDNPFSTWFYKTAPEQATQIEYDLLKVARSIAFSQRYQWMVRFRNGTGYSLRLPVHPFAIPELFKLRDKHPTWDRRKALKHWVSRHWRTIKAEDNWEVLTYVRDHLRGQREFEWFGLDGKILIPQAELELLARMTKERDAMRIVSPRRDRRIRVAVDVK